MPGGEAPLVPGRGGGVRWILLTVENSKLKDKWKRTTVSGCDFVRTRKTKTSYFSLSFLLTLYIAFTFSLAV